MSSIHYEAGRDRWRVQWRTEEGRSRRTFVTRADAEAFVSAGIPDERPARKRGPKMGGRPLTREFIKATVQIDDNGCWIWPLKGGTTGYGQVTRRVNGKIVVRSVHRVSYELFVGPIPEGLELDHLCVVRKCCNPEHLEPVTPAENNRRIHHRDLAVTR